MTTSSDEQSVTVVLELPKEAGATSVAVAGEFNDWSITADPMARRDDGSFAVTLELEPGRCYSYRYWVNDDRWENDWSADAYVPNEYGGENSMIDLRESSPRRQQKAPVSHEPPAVVAPAEAEPSKPKRKRAR